MRRARAPSCRGEVPVSNLNGACWPGDTQMSLSVRARRWHSWCLGGGQRSAHDAVASPVDRADLLGLNVRG
jgi:hypothetical protein